MLPDSDVPARGLVGKRVRLVSLKAQPALNGRLGKVSHFAEAKGRFAVQLEHAGETGSIEKPILLKEANLEDVSAEAAELSARQRALQRGLDAARSVKDEEGDLVVNEVPLSQRREELEEATELLQLTLALDDGVVRHEVRQVAALRAAQGLPATPWSEMRRTACGFHGNAPPGLGSRGVRARTWRKVVCDEKLLHCEGREE